MTTETIKEKEIEENVKMCNNWYEEGRSDMKKDVFGLIDKMPTSALGNINKEELKRIIEGT